jgi:hypothetical protein
MEHVHIVTRRFIDRRNLEKLTVRRLVEVNNGIVGTRGLSGWNQSKAKLIERVLAADAAAPAVIAKRFRRRRISTRFEDVDMRSREAVRMREVYEALVAEFGAAANRDTLRELAVHRVALESQQAAAISGVAKASNRVVRHSNVILKLERALQKAKHEREKRPAGPSLAEYLAGYGAAGAGGSGDGASPRATALAAAGG